MFGMFGNGGARTETWRSGTCSTLVTVARCPVGALVSLTVKRTTLLTLPKVAQGFQATALAGSVPEKVLFKCTSSSNMP